MGRLADMAGHVTISRHPLTVHHGRSMNRTILAGVVAGALLAAPTAMRAQTKTQSASKPGVIYASAEKAKYVQGGPDKGVTASLVWGDTTRGPSGNFTKFAAGYDAGMHTHTPDVLIVVIKGAYLYRDEAGDKRVGPGEFLRIPGGHKHWSGGDKKDGALFYAETFGHMDLIPAK